MLSEIVLDAQSIAILCVFGIPIISIVLSFWYKIERVRSDNDLKRSMVERGMSAEEIERVIAAKK